MRSCKSALLSAFVCSMTGSATAQTALPVRQLREELRIVSSDTKDNMLLTPVNGAMVFADGRIVTLHRQEWVLRVFDANGKLLRMVGRKGKGPGEFASPTTAGTLGDKLWVSDKGRARYVTFGADYAPVPEVVFPRSDIEGGIGGFRLVSATTSVAETFGKVPRINLYKRDGTLSRTFNIPMRHAPAPFSVKDIAPDASGQGMLPATNHSVAHPLSTSTSVEYTPDGEEMLVLESSEIWGGKPGQLRLRRMSTATGVVTPAVTVTLPPRKLTQGEKDSLVAVLAKRNARVADQIKARARPPEYAPAFRTFLVSRDGVVWLQDDLSPNSQTVIDVNGTPLMRVDLPKGLKLFAVSRTTAWGLLKDADDLPIIVRYKVVSQ